VRGFSRRIEPQYALMTERKRSAPVPVSDAIASYVKRSGLAARLSQNEVIPEWTRLVGPQIAAVARPERVAADGTLFVRVATSSWMTELQLMTPEIMARLNAGRGAGRVRGLRWLLST
jgi:predicted nucleic acid-binding Zn ribbon protein